MGKEFVAQKAGPFAEPLLALLYPRLRLLPPERRREALARARAEPLDGFETAGVAGGVALVAWLLDAPGAGAADGSPAAAYLFQFFAALPLLAAFAGPLLLRRTRRGIEREIRRFQP